MHNSREIDDKLVNDFRNKLPGGFNDTLSTPIIAMKATVSPKGKNKQVVLSLETMCLNILTVGQQRKVSGKPMLSHEFGYSLISMKIMHHLDKDFQYF